MLYIANVGEDEIGDDDNDKVKAIREYAAQEDSEVIVISAKIEEEIATEGVMKTKDSFPR